MDILVSSNLERLIFHLLGNDAVKTAELMNALSTQGQYELTDFDAAILELFAAEYATEEETAAEIKRVYDTDAYIEDPHTAVASAVYRKYQAATGDATKTVIASTASPHKFPVVAVEAVTGKAGLTDFLKPWLNCMTFQEWQCHQQWMALKRLQFVIKQQWQLQTCKQRWRLI